MCYYCTKTFKIIEYLYKIKSKKPIGLKKEYIGSTAQKNTNKITKFSMNAFL